MADARRFLLTLMAGSFLTASALVTTALTPAVANADDSDVAQPGGDVQAADEEKPPCPDGSVRSGVSGDCVDQMTSLAEQLNRLPPPPGFGSPQEAVSTLAGGAPPLGGIPGLPLATVNMPDLVLPSLGLGLVPNLAVYPQFPINLPAPAAPALALPTPQMPDLTQLPPPQLPNLTQLPPPQLPDLTKLPPPQLPSLG